LGEFAQQLINGLSLGAIYALIALGYTMVYGVLRFINFAHGDVLMIGAYTAYYLHQLVPRSQASSPLVAVALLAGSMAVCAILGMLIEFLAYRPLRKHAKLTVLITSIGVSLLLSYGGQILFGAGVKPFPDLIPPTRIALGGGVSISAQHLVVIGVAGILLLLLRTLVLHTRFGMALRALSFNPEAASLMGVNTGAVISLTFAIGSALAGAAGVLYALNIGSIEPLMGTLPGIKAFVAAVLGGIGSIPGAALGGVLLGLIESFSGGSALSSYRDAIAFGVLILILLVRPSGLLGQPHPNKV